MKLFEIIIKKWKERNNYIICIDNKTNCIAFVNNGFCCAKGKCIYKVKLHG